MAEDEALAPGTIVGGKYRIERPLGRGGMGSVHLATHVGLETQVAVKVLHGGDTTDEVLARFRREGVVVAKLDSEHVVRVTDTGWIDARTPYLVMELLEGRDLQDEIDARGKLPVAEAVDLVLEACIGVAVAHAAGLVHRDLKPGNLFLARRKGRPPVVKVLDFGLSKSTRGDVLRSLTEETARFGTPSYMPPEQVRSSKRVDARADQYALAVIAYQLLTDRLPFEARALTELFIQIATTTPPPPSSHASAVPPPLDAAILRALSREAEDRFADVAAFAAALAPFGGPRAAELLDGVRAALTPPAPEPPRAAPVSHGIEFESTVDSNDANARLAPAAEVDEDKQTLPRVPRADDSANLASALDSNGPQRRRRVAALGLVAGLAAGTLAWALVGPRRAPRVDVRAGAAIATTTAQQDE
ncbi:MAG TPA: serine/threonine-protein kinase, partial [Minicystis sp.]|nr:serine/threonine-protein kinase [Minicystis sp.]